MIFTLGFPLDLWDPLSMVNGSLPSIPKRFHVYCKLSSRKDRPRFFGVIFSETGAKEEREL